MYIEIYMIFKMLRWYNAKGDVTTMQACTKASKILNFPKCIPENVHCMKRT